MRPLVIIGLLFCLIMLNHVPVFSAPSGISRADLQNLLNAPGNAQDSPEWMSQYQKQTVRWQGEIYAVYDRGPDFPAEVLIKVLPSSRLYDTVVFLPPNHPMMPRLQKGQRVIFEGVLIKAVDTFLVKEVHIELKHMEALSTTNVQGFQFKVVEQEATLFKPKAVY